jgi:hypothetical protein
MVNLAVILETYIREILGSNIGRIQAVFCAFPQSLQANEWGSMSIRPSPIRSKSFLVRHSAVILSFRRSTVNDIESAAKLIRQAKVTDSS